MRMSRPVGEKGQVVIPMDIRKHLGLKKGSEVEFEVREGEVVIRPKEDPGEFVRDFCDVPRKLRRRVNVKRIIEEQTGEEHDVR